MKHSAVNSVLESEEQPTQFFFAIKLIYRSPIRILLALAFILNKSKFIKIQSQTSISKVISLRVIKARELIS